MIDPTKLLRYGPVVDGLSNALSPGLATTALSRLESVPWSPPRSPESVAMLADIVEHLGPRTKAARIVRDEVAPHVALGERSTGVQFGPRAALAVGGAGVAFAAIGAVMLRTPATPPATELGVIAEKANDAATTAPAPRPEPPRRRKQRPRPAPRPAPAPEPAPTAAPSPAPVAAPAPVPAPTPAPTSKPAPPSSPAPRPRRAPTTQTEIAIPKPSSSPPPPPQKPAPKPVPTHWPDGSRRVPPPPPAGAE